jgi:hypothetical protein
MHAVRLHLGVVFQWGIAVAFLAATFAVGLLILREFHSLRVPAPERVREPVPATASAPPVPPLAVSVTSLGVSQGTEIRIGDTIDRVSGLVGNAAETGKAVTEAGPLGPRLTRFYQVGSTRFTVVFEPFERHGVQRVTAIYVQ